MRYEEPETRTPNCLLHEVPTWSNMAEEVFTIRRRSLDVRGTNESKGNKI